MPLPDGCPSNASYLENRIRDSFRILLVYSPMNFFIGPKTNEFIAVGDRPPTFDIHILWIDRCDTLASRKDYSQRMDTIDHRQRRSNRLGSPACRTFPTAPDSARPEKFTVMRNRCLMVKKTRA